VVVLAGKKLVSVYMFDTPLVGGVKVVQAPQYQDGPRLPYAAWLTARG